jgi:hypothetical protein
VGSKIHEQRQWRVHVAAWGIITIVAVENSLPTPSKRLHRTHHIVVGATDQPDVRHLVRASIRRAVLQQLVEQVHVPDLADSGASARTPNDGDSMKRNGNSYWHSNPLKRGLQWHCVAMSETTSARVMAANIG